MFARRLAPEKMVVRDHAMHLSPRQIKAFGNVAHGLGGNEAQLVLNGVQQRQQSARDGLVRINKLLNGRLARLLSAGAW
jgi:hypothetical protein